MRGLLKNLHCNNGRKKHVFESNHSGYWVENRSQGTSRKSHLHVCFSMIPWAADRRKLNLHLWIPTVGVAHSHAPRGHFIGPWASRSDGNHFCIFSLMLCCTCLIVITFSWHRGQHPCFCECRDKASETCLGSQGLLSGKGGIEPTTSHPSS